MTIAVDLGRKATKQTINQLSHSAIYFRTDYCPSTGSSICREFSGTNKMTPCAGILLIRSLLRPNKKTC